MKEYLKKYMRDIIYSIVIGLLAFKIDSLGDEIRDERNFRRKKISYIEDNYSVDHHVHGADDIIRRLTANHIDYVYDYDREGDKGTLQRHLYWLESNISHQETWINILDSRTEHLE